MIAQRPRWSCVFWSAIASVVVTASFAGEPDQTTPSIQPKPLLYRKVPVPKPFLVTKAGVTFGGDLRIGDLNGDGKCDLLVYRCNHGAPSGAHQGGLKPTFLGAFDLEGKPLWSRGEGGNQPSRPMSVAVHDITGDRAAEVICFWHRPDLNVPADWRSPADICGDRREELVVWDPTAASVFIYTPAPLDEKAYTGFRPGPRQYNPRLMD